MCGSVVFSDVHGNIYRISARLIEEYEAYPGEPFNLDEFLGFDLKPGFRPGETEMYFVPNENISWLRLQGECTCQTNDHQPESVFM